MQSAEQCRGVWAGERTELERGLASFRSLDAFNDQVNARKAAMLPRMVGPFRDSAQLLAEVHAWVQQARAAVGNRIGMEAAQLQAA